MSPSDPRWKILAAREDGPFFYSVRTTGVYCRPSCGARRARPENVAFHDTAAAAEAAGFRPCLRCRPDLPALADRRAEVVAKLCRLIERAGRTPTLAELARHAALSPFHTHRLFRAATGLTPRAYAAAHRAHRVRVGLRERSTVTEAIHEAGYGSTARFYEKPVLGMTPTRFRAGGAGEEIRFALASCSLGRVLVAATGRGVCAILFGDDPRELERDLARRFPRARLEAAERSFDRVVRRVVKLVESPSDGSSLPLDIRGTAFQQRVWLALSKVPSGTTTTYDALARAAGVPRAVRAVAGACGANPLAVAIPCHRVVRKDGDLSGYRWGVDRKKELLARETRVRPRAAGRGPRRARGEPAQGAFAVGAI